MDEHITPCETQGWSDEPAAGSGGQPSVIGRYRVIRQLGQGGFGRVYQAHDSDLDRFVAIKVPNPERIADVAHVEEYLAEARTLAGLDHAHIVPVYDVGRTVDVPCFVVSKYIEGTDLATGIRQARPLPAGAAELVAVVAEALHYAHTRGVVHRDIKPANILLDLSGRPWVADFGLALRDEDFGQGSRLAGTPAYMSPEQARGEGHRVDGRSDIFSLGTVLYELLTGRRPFRARTGEELLELITQAEPRPPRQIDDTIPRELERICLKALSKRASERYSTARDMAEDLRLFLQAGSAAGPATAPGPTTVPPGTTRDGNPPTTGRSGTELPPEIIPKGLRSFDRHDADFFLTLLPGPRDRNGLPDALRFWKTRIEMSDPDATFRVGLIYGPSGCGKSSLVKAGLLPRLARHVLPVYIEASARETEARLLKGVRKECREIPADRGLVASLSLLRRGRVTRPGQKVLLVIDQFEQWLIAARGDENPELVDALRHCDGEHVQAVVMVRDDFWMAATRFMRSLEIRLVEGENSAAVDLFDPQHARRVLKAFGRAFGRLPARDRDLTREQESFLDLAVAGLAQDGKVISVRLALFAEMVKGKPWTPGTLREVGGTEGVGVTFLEETFGASTAPPEYRLHRDAAQAVLAALLPPTGADIKGRMRPESELLAASGYDARPAEFEDLIRVLDLELRLITPTDDEGATDAPRPGGPEGERHYQLTHDYLVHSLRDWLTRNQRQTRRGRAELLLADRAALWVARPEKRNLPTLAEWASIRLLTRRRRWSDSERRMMRRADRVVGVRALGLAAVLCALVVAGLEVRREIHASGLVEQLLRADIARVPEIVEAMRGYRRWTDSELRRIATESPGGSTRKLHASLALLPVDASQEDYLRGRLLSAPPAELKVIGRALRAAGRRQPERFRAILEDGEAERGRRLRAACALAMLVPDDAALARTRVEIAAWLLARENRYLLGDWAELLRPVKGRLIEPLSAAFLRSHHPEESEAAASVLAAYLEDMPALLALLAAGEAGQNAALLQTLTAVGNPLAGRLGPEVEAALAATGGSRNDRTRRANLALVALALGRGEPAWPLFRHGEDDGLRTDLIHRSLPAGVAARTIEGRLAVEQEASVRQALVLALGEYPLGESTPGDREQLRSRLRGLYRDDPDAGVHAAAEWVLRRWGDSAEIGRVDRGLVSDGPSRGRRWYVNRGLHTMAVVAGPVEFTMGSPAGEPGRKADEHQHPVRIGRSFAIATKETTLEQLARAKLAVPGRAIGTPPEGLPADGVSVARACMYCRFLSELEGTDESQMCYPPPEVFSRNGMKPYPDYLTRTGYRLLTEAEWEYSCRAGTTTAWFPGDDETDLREYAWHYQNSAKGGARPVGLLKPNPLGLFDMLGNVREWCSDTYARFDVPRGPRAVEDGGVVLGQAGDSRVLRGGSILMEPAQMRSASRDTNPPGNPVPYLGFRVARTVEVRPAGGTLAGR